MAKSTILCQFAKITENGRETRRRSLTAPLFLFDNYSLRFRAFCAILTTYIVFLVHYSALSSSLLSRSWCDTQKAIPTAEHLKNLGRIRLRARLHKFFLTFFLVYCIILVRDFFTALPAQPQGKGVASRKYKKRRTEFEHKAKHQGPLYSTAAD